MQITSFSFPTYRPWDYDTPDTTGIGGSETAQIEMAERLAQRGHEVMVYAPVAWPGRRTAPRGSVWEHSDLVDTARPGVWIINRSPEILDSFPVEHPGQQLYFLAEDTFYHGMTEARAAKLDYYICLCRDHAAYVKSIYPYVADKILIGSNGVKGEVIREIAENPPPRNPRKLVFASSPDRGLLPLLEIFKRAREWVHDLELHVFYGFQNLLKSCEGQPDSHPAMQLYRQCMKAMDQPGVVWHDRTPQKDLYREWFSAGIWCTPSTFTESNCITAQEAQACGAIPVAIPIWAVGEFVRHGILLHGDPYRDALTRARFVAAIYKLASAPALQQQIRSEMMPWAQRTFDWERTIDRMERWFEGVRRPRFSVIFLDYHTDDRLAAMRAKSRAMLERHLNGAEWIEINLAGQAYAVNEGMARATGEYLVVVSNDVYVDDPDFLEKLAQPDTVTAYAGTNCDLTGKLDLAMDLWCMPRNVYEAIGGYGYEAAYADGYGYDEWDMLARVRQAGFATAIHPVRAEHVGASSTFRAHHDPEAFRRMAERNRAVFKKQWPQLEPVGGWLV